MTSEVLLMNQEAVVLAADSAVSGGRSKMVGVEKVYPISNDPPVGVMIYNVATFNGVSWRVFFEDFRSKNSNSKLKIYEIFYRIQDYFKSALRDPAFRIDPEQERANFYKYLVGFYNSLAELMALSGWDGVENPSSEMLLEALEYIEWDIAYEYDSESEDPEPVRRGSVSVTPELYEFFNKNFEEISGYAFEAVISENDLEIEEIKIEEDVFIKLRDAIIKSCVTQWVPYSLKYDYTGVVIAGFEANSLYPSAVHFKIYPSFGGILNITDIHRIQISPDADDAVVKTFAQAEIVNSFLHSIEPRAKDALVHEVRRYLNALKNAVETITTSLSSEKAAEVDEIFSHYWRVAPRVIKYAVRRLPSAGNQQAVNWQLSAAPPDRVVDIAEKLLTMNVLGAELRMNATVGRPLRFMKITRSEIILSEKK